MSYFEILVLLCRTCWVRTAASWVLLFLLLAVVGPSTCLALSIEVTIQCFPWFCLEGPWIQKYLRINKATLLPNWHPVCILFHVGQEGWDCFWVINGWFSAALVGIHPWVHTTMCLSTSCIFFSSSINHSLTLATGLAVTFLYFQSDIVSDSEGPYWCRVYFSWLLQTWNQDYVGEIKSSNVIHFSFSHHIVDF